jgi:predicted dehydrogenase
VFASGRGDNAVIALDHANGSVSAIAYTSGGDPASGKERIEMFGGGISAAIDDFKLTVITRAGTSRRDKLETTQDKGHREELARFVAMVTNAAPPPMSISELRSSSLAAIAVLESLSVGMPIDL